MGTDLRKRRDGHLVRTHKTKQNPFWAWFSHCRSDSKTNSNHVEGICKRLHISETGNAVNEPLEGPEKE